MAWSARSNVTTGTLITAAMWNAGVTNDTYLGQNHDHKTAVGAGDGGALNFPTCIVYASAVQAIATASSTNLTFNSEAEDTTGMHSIVSNTDQIVVATAGKYIVWVNGKWDTNATGHRLLTLSMSGNEFARSQIPPVAGGVYNTGQALCAIVRAVATDFFRATVFQDSGGNLNFDATNTKGAFGAAYLGA